MATQVFPAQILRLNSLFLQVAREYQSRLEHRAMHLVSTLMLPAITGRCLPPPLLHKPEGFFAQQALARRRVVLAPLLSLVSVDRSSIPPPATSSLPTPTQSAAMSRLVASTKSILSTHSRVARSTECKLLSTASRCPTANQAVSWWVQ